MKKIISMALIFITASTLTAGSSYVFALSNSNSTTVSSTTGSESTVSVSNENDFQKRKIRILKHISDRLIKIKEIQSCVQAATNLDALKACRPHRDKEHGGKKW
jgi:hypothetical protein